MSQLNLQYLPWDDAHILPKNCRAYRRKQNRANTPIRGKNLAVVLVEFGGQVGQHFVRGCSSPEAQKHSEVIAVETLAEMLDDNDQEATIKAIYTERAPCTVGPGMRDCDSFLYNFLKNFTKRAKLGKGWAIAPYGVNTLVYYSFMYPSSGKAEIEEILNDHQLLGIEDEDDDTMTLSDYFKETGKQDRAEVTKILQNYKAK